MAADNRKSIHSSLFLMLWEISFFESRIFVLY